MSNQEVFVALYNKYIKREGAAELLAWLENETEFFTAPAGAKHHGAHTGELVEHSLNVHHRLAKIASVEIFGVSGRIDLLAEDVKESIAIMGLLHDVCKHDVYHADGRGGFRYSDPFPFGHGEKSAYLISQHMKLTPAEALAIRWHMGAFDAAARGDLRMLNAAMDATPWVWWLHEADMGAARIDEKEVENDEPLQSVELGSGTGDKRHLECGLSVVFREEPVEE